MRWALILVGACGAAAPPPPPAPPAPMKSIPLQLAANQQLTFGNGVTLRYDNLVLEEIAAGPSPAYPAGSGLTLTLILEGQGDPQRRSVSLLSEGYTSKREAWFDRYRVTLDDVTSPHRDAVVALHIDQVTDQAGPPTFANVTKGSSVALGSAEMIFKGHGSKHIGPGETSPLMVALDYSVPGEEPEHVELNAGEGPRPSWRWRDYRLTVVAHEFDESMRLEIARLQLAPVQPL